MIIAAGLMITALANELVLLFLGLELISIPTYVLLFLGRRDRASGEATMKYFYLSLLSSALLLYGFSLLYGLGKTTLIAGTAANPGIREAITALSPTAPLAPLASLALGLAAAAAATAATQGAYRGGITAMLFYVFVYALATMGTFAALAHLGSSRRDLNDVDELAGLGRSQPLVAGALAVFMFSLAGLPPLAGFWGKFNLFAAAIELATSAPSRLALWFTILAVAGALNAAIAAAYYLRIVAVMYFQSGNQPVIPLGGRTARFAAVLCAILVIAVGAWPGRILDVAVESESTLQPRARTVQSSPSDSLQFVRDEAAE